MGVKGRNGCGGADKIFPVDLKILGNPPTPKMILKGLLALVYKIEKEHLKESIQQDIWEILLLEPDLRCTCDEVIRETEIYQAQGHYHHCMLWQVARAVEISFRIMVNRDPFVFDESGKSGRFQTNRNKESRKSQARLL